MGKNKFLAFEVELIIDDNDKKKKWKAIDKDTAYKQHALFPNHFPYHFEDEIAHLVLWPTERLEKSKVDAIIQDAYPQMSYLWWENPIGKKTVPDVPHVQVLVRMEDNDRQSLLLQGYIKQILEDLSYQLPR